MRLRLWAPAFRPEGIQYERDQAVLALQDGKLCLDRASKWLDALKEDLSDRSTTPHAEEVLKQGLMDVIEEAALNNKQWLKVSELPEILVMDLERLNTFRSLLRRLAVSASLVTLVKAWVKKHGVHASTEHVVSLCTDALAQADSGSNTVAIITAEVVQVLGDEKKVKGLAAALRAGMKPKQGSLRRVFTQRISDVLRLVLTNAATADELTSKLQTLRLDSFSKEILALGSNIHALALHLDAVYRPLITAVVGSKS